MSTHDLFGQPIVRDVLLRERFLEPPFTILDTKQKSWQARKRAWLAKGIKSEESREEVVVIANSFGEKYGRGQGMKNEVSVFDPALCELMYRWFCPAGGRVLDLFAGGSVRGIVANYLGFDYTGIDLREEQIAANYKNAGEIEGLGRVPNWIAGDSDKETEKLFEAGQSYDMVFTCPPYMDLEVYSDKAEDLSTMSLQKFDTVYSSIIRKGCALLRPNSFAVFVVGDVRDKDGFYKDFIGITKRAFAAAGVPLYNEAILVQPYGTAMLRANKVYGTNKKLVKVHENVLIFYKGDPRAIKAKFKAEGDDEKVETEETLNLVTDEEQTTEAGQPEGPMEGEKSTGNDEQCNDGDIEPFS